MRQRVAYEVVLDDGPGGGVTIDGVPFPYHVYPDIEVVGTERNEMLGVRVTILADNVCVRQRGREGPRWWTQRGSELAAARDRGRAIVRDGLSEALPWLRHAKSEVGS